ncbi:hypothetical protein GRF59_21580 [Paenibacillus sp. HJL G12]|uniref:Uncharacterized protein n=1 Tax=Paenibacillus dendrobii TaxID=2691084 RepID=A0A7X3IQ56_9BACL|nr:hypothetical protein [Paenibacillus dendrobii]MWV46202.1 hypothetical protein [Paenibacillus dendrobii]
MKITRWLIKVVLTVALISGLTVMTTGVIVNSYVQSLLSSFNITLEGQSLSLGSMMKGMLGFKSGGSADKTSETKDNAQTPEKKDTADLSGSNDKSSLTGGSVGTSDSDISSSGENKPADGSTDGSRGTDANSAESGEAPDNAVPVMGQGLIGQSAAESQSAQDQQVLISPDDVAKKKQELTTSEKEQIFSILMTKLPQAEMQKISSAMEDGLTEDELKTIEDSISKYLSTEEYNVLKGMLEQE